MDHKKTVTGLKGLHQGYLALKISMSHNLFPACMRYPLSEKEYVRWKTQRVKQFREEVYAWLQQVESYYDKLYSRHAVEEKQEGDSSNGG